MRKRHFGTVYEDRRGDGSSRGFAVRWTDGEGRRQHKRGFPTRGAAEDFVLERFAEVRAAKSRRRGETPEGRLSLRELSPRVLDAWKGYVRKVTHTRHVIQLRQWSAALGEVPVEKLTTKAVQEAVDLMLRPREEGEAPTPAGVPRGLKASSMRTMVRGLSGAFRILRGMGVDIENPCRRGAGLILPTPQQRGQQGLTDEQLSAFLRAAPAVADAFAEGRYGEGRVARRGKLSAQGRHVVRAAAVRRYVLEVLADTGLRPEELRRLRWSWIDGDITAFELGETKTHDTRVVPLTAAGARALRDLRAKLVSLGLPPEPDDLVFPIGYTMLNALVKATAAAAGLGHVTPYRLRHSYGQGLIRKGVQIEDVAKVMGHSNIQTTHRYTRGAAGGAVGRVRTALGAGLSGDSPHEAAPAAPVLEGGQPGTAPEPAAPAGPAPGALPS